MIKTAEEIINTLAYRQFVNADDEYAITITLPNAVSAMEAYAAQKTAQFYTLTEVGDLIKKVLHDAAERAEITEHFDYNNQRLKPFLIKESITNIDVNQYLTK